MTAGDIRKLGDVAVFMNGGAWNQNEYVDPGIPVVRVSDCHEGTVDLTDCKYLPASSLSLYAKHRLVHGDLIIATVGSHPTQPGSVVGRPTIVPKQAQGALLNQNSVCIRPRDRSLDKGYLGYLGRSDYFREYIIACARGSANQVWMSISLLKQMPVPIPPPMTQHKIAAILSAYDDLIENNLRRIKILEEMAQALYREWFVNFRFPGHESVRMVDGIPEGWEIRRAVDGISVNPRMEVPKAERRPYVAMEGLSTSSMLVEITEFREGNSGAKYRNGDTLFARITPCLENGKTGFVQFLPSDDSVGIGSTEFIVLRSRTLCPEYVYILARFEDFRSNAIKSMTGASGRQRVRSECFDNYLFAHPDTETLSAFSGLVEPMFTYAHMLSQKNANLRQTRDLLLPKLISGEVDVSELDIEIGEVET